MPYYRLGNVFSPNIFITSCISAAFIAMGSTVYAGDYSCKQALREAGSTLRTKVAVRAFSGEPKYDFSLSQGQLTAHTMGMLEVKKNSYVNGLTDAYLEDRSKYMVEKLTLPSGSTCVWPSSYELQIGYSSMTVYVANEFRKGSCPYAVTMRHELEHVKINNETLHDHRADLERKLKSHIETFFPIRVDKGQDPDKAVSENLRYTSRRFVDRMTSERDHKHSQLDSPESYAYWQSLCHDWSTN